MVHTTSVVKYARRDINPWLKMLRNFFYQRWPLTPQTRWTDDLSPADQPPPSLPDGPAHALSKNYYHTRDNRRAYMPDVVIVEEQKKLAAGTSDQSKDLAVETKSKSKFGVTPGDMYITGWTSKPTQYHVAHENDFMIFGRMYSRK